jgi:MFS family permease
VGRARQRRAVRGRAGERCLSSLLFTTGSLQWVVNIYTIVFGGLLMLGGRAADLLGQRRVFIAGTMLFVLAVRLRPRNVGS